MSVVEFDKDSVSQVSGCRRMVCGGQAQRGMCKGLSDVFSPLFVMATRRVEKQK